MRRLGTQAVVDVCDDGPGIPPDRRNAAFHRFQRGLDTKEPGYGLGLSIVQRAVELHDGTIELLEAPTGQGLLVRIRLDALAPPPIDADR